MTINDLNTICLGSFVDQIGLRFTEMGDDYIVGILEINSSHLQPVGVVHGGVFISMAETLAGAGSMLLVQPEGKQAFGTTINSQHIASVTSGILTAKAELLHKGIFKHIWDVKITDDIGKLISISRVTNSIK